MNEEQLVKLAQSGDFEAFAELINAQKTKLYNLALKMTGNRQDAEDIIQETLLKAVDNIDQFRGEAAFGTWLYSIALNQARSHLAREKRAELLPIESYLPGGGTNQPHESESVNLFDWKDPLKMLENDELHSIIDQALASLPIKYREAFVLRYYDEYSIKEIAALIKESEASTKSRVLRARLAMRDYLSKAFEDNYG